MRNYPQISTSNNSEVRELKERLSNLESQMENIHSLNRELISLLERSQMETASLRPGKKNFGSG